jgi:hypothetical protein
MVAAAKRSGGEACTVTKNKKIDKKKTRKHKVHSEAKLAAAVAAAGKRKSNLSKVAIAQKIASSTLRDARARLIAGKQRGRPGRKSVLTELEETRLVSWLQNNSKRGTPVSADQLCQKVQQFIACAPRPNPFGRECLPGRGWVRTFYSRHKAALKYKVPRNLDRARAGAVNPHSISGTYMKWRLVTKDVDPEDIWNQDEQGYEMDPPQKKKVFTAKDEKTPHAPGANNRQHVTTLQSISTTGKEGPRLLLFEGVEMLPELGDVDFGDDSDPDAAPAPHTVFAFRSKAYVDGEMYPKYFEIWEEHTRRYDEAGKLRKRVLVFDGYGAHEEDKAVQWALDHEVALFEIAAHSSHAWQPLDRVPFGVQKAAYAAEVSAWKSRSKHIGMKITPVKFCELWGKANKKAFTKDNIVTAWERTGLWPINDQAVNKFIALAEPFFKPEATEDQMAEILTYKTVAHKEKAEVDKSLKNTSGLILTSPEIVALSKKRKALKEKIINDKAEAKATRDNNAAANKEAAATKKIETEKKKAASAAKKATDDAAKAKRKEQREAAKVVKEAAEAEKREARAAKAAAK